MTSWLTITGLAALAVVGAFFAGHWTGDSAGYARKTAEIAAADAKAELLRKGDNAKLTNMSAYDLCVVGLHGSGVHDVSACDQLRGL